MSWGERSCVKPCQAPKDYCTAHSCNVDCPYYKWDGETMPDTVSKKQEWNKKTTPDTIS